MKARVLVESDEEYELIVRNLVDMQIFDSLTDDELVWHGSQV